MKRTSTITTETAVTAAKRSKVKTAPKRKQKLTNSIVKFPTVGFPTKLTAKLRYAETFTLTSTAGVVGTQNFAANGLFDPNLTGAGHQPMYFDQYMAVYNHFTVLGAKITITAINTSGTVPMNIGCYLNDDATAVTSMQNALEESNSTFKMLGTTGADSKTLVRTFSAKGTFGGSLLSDANLQGNATTNPPELSVFTVQAQSADATSTGTVVCMAVIDYVATFQELKDPASN